MVSGRLCAKRLMFVDEMGSNTSLLSSMTIEGMGPSLTIEGATTSRIFETYVEKVLVPSRAASCSICRPTLSRLQPHRRRGEEEAFAKIKNLLRKAATRSKEALVEAIGAALCAVSAADAGGFFEHAGYCPTGQLP